MISYSLHSVNLHATYKLKKMKFCLVLILLILKLTQKGSGQCIQFQFTSQPPTELSCNPYDVRVDPAVWRLRMSCDVRRISGTDEFDVHWFHKNNENEIIDLGQVEVQGESSNRELVVLGTQRINTPFDESMLGEYWCQVIVTSTQPNTCLGKSDILMIRDPEDYDTLSTCSGIVSVPTSKCADEKVTLQTIQPFTSSSSFSSSPSIFLPSFSSSSFFTSSSSSSFSLLSSSPSFSSSSSSSFSSSSSSSFSSSIKWTVLTYSSSSFTTSSSSSSLLVTHTNSQTNIKTYSSIQINTPSMTSDSGLASSHIIVITVTITTIMLGILLVISCFLIVCIKRNKRNKDTIYYLTPDDIITPNPCTQFKTSTPTESVEYVTILLEESNNFTRTPVSDNNHYYSVIHNEIVTSQEESHKSLELSKTPVNESSHYYSVINKDMITTQEEKYKSLESNNTTRAPVSDNNHYYSVINKDMITTQEEKYKSLESNNTTRAPVSDNNHYYNVFNKEIVATQEESYQPLECTTIISENDYTTLMK